MTKLRKTIVSVIARTGYIAKGMVYFLVGLLTMQAALGMGGEVTGTKQALKEFINQPFGSVLLIGCVVGLFAHAVWRIIKAIFDPQNKGKNLGTLFFRAIDFFTGCLYISLAYAAWQIFQGLNTQSSDTNTEVWIAKILELPYGKWLVFLLALIIVATGFYQFYSAYYARFDYNFDKEKMSGKEKKTLRQFGRIGISAWGIVYCMIGFLFYQAAKNFNAESAGGLEDALNALREQPFGTWILGITSAGMLIYGIYLLILSYYHQVYR